MTDGKKWVCLLLIVLVAVPSVWLVAQESIENPLVEEKGTEGLSADAITEEVAKADVIVDEVVAEVVVIEAAIEEDVAEVIEEVAEEVVAGEITEEVADEIVEEVIEEAVVEEAIVEEMAGEIIEEAVAPVVPKVIADDSEISSLDDIIASEALKRMAYKKHAVETLNLADKALSSKQYKDARTLYESTAATLDKIGRRPEDKRIRKSTQAGLADTLYEWALSLRKQKDLEAANQMARAAAVAGHPKAVDLIGDIAEERINPKPEPEPKDVVRWKEADYVTEKADIAKRLRQGRQFYMSGELDKANMEFESILKRDPYNTEAIRMLQKTSNRRYDISTMEFRATRDSMLKDVQDTWNPRTYALGEEVASDIIGDGTPAIDETSDRIVILDKMKAIMIPEIEFRQANINDVIDFLQEASRDFDTETDPNKKGVNIILNIGDNTSPIADDTVASDDPFAETVSENAASGGGVPSITFSARHISLLEALKIVTKVSNLKYRVEDSVVMILPWDAAEGEIIVRMYNVLPSVEERLVNVGNALGATGGGNDRDSGGFTAMEGQSIDTAGANWKEAFGEMGVKWPKESSIKYVSAMGKLVVGNTADNLTVFERVLAELNVVPSQIEIESRFVEVGQKDLDALGLEWGLTDDWEVAQKKSTAGDPLSGRQRVVVEEGSFSAGNRFLTAGTEMGGVAIADNILSIAGVLTNPELKVVLHALDQKGSTDLLSAPKVLTQSGAEATIKVVTEYIYPTDFEVTPITATSQGGSGDSQIIGGIVEPSEFETREVGVILTVLPEVSPEGQMINLTMTPQVVSDPTWKNYGTTYTDPQGNQQQLNMEQPFFFTRSISTSIAVYNNATVVMGGMITEKHDEVNDRIPILGDIPLIGRLFQSNYEHSEKRNLLIFVTARLVDPAGRPIKDTNLSNL